MEWSSDIPQEMQDASVASSSQKRKMRKKRKTEQIQNEGTSAKGYVSNPMLSDSGRTARKNRANIRDVSEQLGLVAPEFAQKRQAGNQLSNYAKAMARVNGAQAKAKAVVIASSGSANDANEIASSADKDDDRDVDRPAGSVVQSTPHYGPEDPEI